MNIKMLKPKSIWNDSNLKILFRMTSFLTVFWFRLCLLICSQRIIQNLSDNLLLFAYEIHIRVKFSCNKPFVTLLFVVVVTWIMSFPLLTLLIFLRNSVLESLLFIASILSFYFVLPSEMFSKKGNISGLIRTYLVGKKAKDKSNV